MQAEPISSLSIESSLTQRHLAHSLTAQTGPQCFYRITRRAFEIIVSLLGSLLLALLVPFVWLANRLFSPGPLFYRQTRVGKDGERFLILKFRSMIVDAESAGAVWASEADPRITHVGQFLRKTHLDELPQVWQVLTGQMSLIGPRPERPIFVAELEKTLPFYQQRHTIKPGITGWAQVNHHYGGSVDDAAIKLHYDLVYVAQQNWRLDCKILWRTMRSIFRFEGR